MNRLKPIRSFVHRERKLGRLRQEAVQLLWDKYVINHQNGIIDFPKTANCINIEIGFGMGEMLFNLAQNNPQELFIGIEVHLPGIAALLAKLKIAPLDNLKIYHHDAIEILTNCIPDNCINNIFLFFPDPWPKQRHHKRRIVQPAFATLIYRKLKRNGCFYCATDIENYAEHIMRVLTTNNFIYEIEKSPSRPPTKFEQRGIREGRNIWNLSFSKKRLK